jgi:hypothetical protein
LQFALQGGGVGAEAVAGVVHLQIKINQLFIPRPLIIFRNIVK